MNLELTRPPDAQRALFAALRTPRDVAEILEVSYDTLIYHVYRIPPFMQYKEFLVQKRAGGSRLIRAPATRLKILQQKLATILSNVYNPRRCAHGFVKDRSIVTNAKPHVGSAWVLNVDLKDFFPSINYGRVRGVFMAQPLGVPEEVSDLLARMCCYRGELPQGAPTSPAISNMIAAKLDGDLKRLAGQLKCRYSRYADDLTFSTYRLDFPDDLACYVSVGETVKVGVGHELESIILENGFSIAEEKVSLRFRSERQEVTGIVINEKLNVRRSYIRELRAMLHSWDRDGYAGASAKLDSLNPHPDKHPLLPAAHFKDVLKGKIGYLAMVRGLSDPLVRRYWVELQRLRLRDAV